MGWVKGSDRNFEASQTERYRKTKKDRRERETSGGGPKIRVRGRGSSTCAPGSGPRIAFRLELEPDFPRSLQTTRAKARCSVGAPEMAKRRSPSAEDLRKMGNVRVPSDWQPFGGFNDYARSFYPFWAAPQHMTRSHSHARSLTRGA